MRADGHEVTNSSVQRALRRRGLLLPQGFRADRKSWAALRRRVFHDPPTERNRVWQTDFSEFETANGGIWRISAVIDYVSKYCLAITVTPDFAWPRRRALHSAGRRGSRPRTRPDRTLLTCASIAAKWTSSTPKTTSSATPRPMPSCTTRALLPRKRLPDTVHRPRSAAATYPHAHQNTTDQRRHRAILRDLKTSHLSRTSVTSSVSCEPDRRVCLSSSQPAPDPVAVGPSVRVVRQPVHRFGPQPREQAQFLGLVRTQSTRRTWSLSARRMPVIQRLCR